MDTVTYMAEVLRFVFSTYQTTGAMAVRLVDANTGEPYCTLSVNGTEAEMERLPQHAFFLKDWSENAGIAQHLLDQHVLAYSKPHLTLQAGHAGWADSVVVVPADQRTDPKTCAAEYACEYHA